MKWFKSFARTNNQEKSEHLEKKLKAAPAGKVMRDGVRSDSPIRIPEHDAYGFDPFAKAIAKSITLADASDGLVYAINGTWGSGKSSAINLILHHLSLDTDGKQIITTTFNPWWFSGAEALTISFFQEMRATVGKSLDEQAREAMATLGSRLSSAGPLLGGIASLLATPAMGAAVAGGATFIERLTKMDRSVEGEYRKLADALAAHEGRFLIVLDDIDRLNPDDALQVFKLVKSVGRLPNVIYLMAFDRHLAEKIVAERFPAERTTYLEKIVQGAFDLPNPDTRDLQNQLLTTLEKAMGVPEDGKMQRFWNIFFDGVAPFLRTPRDTVRLCNVVKVSWPAVAGDVDRADFLAIEALRLFMPSVHQAVRARPEMVTGKQPERGHSRERVEEEYNGIFLSGLAKPDQEIAKQTLRRLFPRLDAVWANVWHDDRAQWKRDRLICCEEHFATYFAFNVIDDGITAAETAAFIRNAGVPGATAKALLDYLAMPRRRGGTRAALALEEFQVHADDIAEESVPQFLKDIFSVADELNVQSDVIKGVNRIGSNQLRIHWLLNELLLDRFSLEKRTEFIRGAAPGAALEWLISFSGRCKTKKDERETDKDDGKANFVDDQTVDWLYALSLERLRSAAADGNLIRQDGLEALLYRWRDRAGDAEVRQWTDAQLGDNKFVIAMANDVISASYSHGMGGFGFLGDRVSRKTEYVNLMPLRGIMDVDGLKARISSLIDSPVLAPVDRAILERFRSTPERDPERLD